MLPLQDISSDEERQFLALCQAIYRSPVGLPHYSLITGLVQSFAREAITPQVVLHYSQQFHEEFETAQQLAAEFNKYYAPGVLTPRQT